MASLLAQSLWPKSIVYTIGGLDVLAERREFEARLTILVIHSHIKLHVAYG